MTKDILKQKILETIEAGKSIEQIWEDDIGNSQCIVKVEGKFYNVFYFDYFDIEILDFNEVVPIRTIQKEYVTPEEYKRIYGMAGFGGRFHVIQGKYLLPYPGFEKQEGVPND